jgi:hypothetical protein
MGRCVAALSTKKIKFKFIDSVEYKTTQIWKKRKKNLTVNRNC